MGCVERVERGLCHGLAARRDERLEHRLGTECVPETELVTLDHQELRRDAMIEPVDDHFGGQTGGRRE